MSISEKDYCLISDLATARAITSLLRSIVPGCGHTLITKDECAQIGITVYEWQQRIQQEIENDGKTT